MRIPATKLKTRIGIVGYGYVGKAMTEFFKHHYDLVIYDTHVPEYSGNRDALNQCDVAFVCVPTPMNEDTGRCDASIVESVVDWLEAPLIVIKSTVEPGTTDRLREKTSKRIVFSPEYCGESTYWSPYAWHRDVIETPFFIFGGSHHDTRRVVDLYVPIGGPVKQYRQTSAYAAEMAKYMENVFYATKIAFCYEMASICKQAGVDYNEVRELWLLDPRINPMHTSVFAENDLPFSGKCLPKDTNALASYASSLGYEAELLKEVLKTNERIGKLRKEER